MKISELRKAFILGLTGGLYMNMYRFGTREYMIWDDEYNLGASAARDIKQLEMEERKDRFLKDGVLWSTFENSGR